MWFWTKEYISGNALYLHSWLHGTFGGIFPMVSGGGGWRLWLTLVLSHPSRTNSNNAIPTSRSATRGLNLWKVKEDTHIMSETEKQIDWKEIIWYREMRDFYLLIPSFDIKYIIQRMFAFLAKSLYFFLLMSERSLQQLFFGPATHI
jgi:hypothetical protein